MSRSPFFSIITPTYNRAHYLPEMLESVQQQTFENYEHIIVDDGSEDDTESIISAKASSDPRIKYIKQSNEGRSVARNVGIENSQGEYVCFLDSDDVWLPNHLAELNKAISTQIEPAFYHTGLIWFYEDKTPDKQVVYRPRHLYTSDAEFAIVNQFAPDCVCVPKAVLLEDQFNPNLSINEDMELWGRITSNYPVISVEAATAKLRVHSGNTSAIVEDAITPMKHVFELLINQPKVRNAISSAFIKDRKRGLDELTIRHFEAEGNRTKTILATLIFLLKYPTNTRNSAKLVSLLYQMPGGSIIKRLKQG